MKKQMSKIDNKKIQAYDLLRQINAIMIEVKQLQKELNQIEEEIFKLENEEKENVKS